MSVRLTLTHTHKMHAKCCSLLLILVDVERVSALLLGPMMVAKDDAEIHSWHTHKIFESELKTIRNTFYRRKLWYFACTPFTSE